MAFSVGSLVADLGFNVNDSGRLKYQRDLRTLRGDVAKPVTAELKGDYDRRGLEAYERKLKEVRASAGRKQGLQAKLGADFDNRAFREYEKALKGVNRQADHSVGAQGRLRTSFGAVYGRGGALFTAAGGLYAVQAGLRKVTDEAEESIKVSAQTEAVLKSTGNAANVTAKQVSDLATSISLKTAQDDEAIQKGANLLLTFKNVRNEAGEGRDIFNQTTAAAVDLSAAGFGSLESASKQLGKALNDPLKGLTALGRSGVTFSEQQKKHIERLVETGKAADFVAAQQLVLKEVQSQVGGSAAAQARPLDRLRVVYDNLAETIGLALMPYLEKAATWAADFVEQMRKGEGPGGRFRDQLAQVADKLKDVFEAGKDVAGFLKDHTGLVKAAAAAWLGYKGAVKGAKAITGIGSLLSAGRGGGATGRAGGIIAGGGARGMSVATPLYVKEVTGGLGGAPGAAGGKPGTLGKITMVAARVSLAAGAIVGFDQIMKALTGEDVDAADITRPKSQGGQGGAFAGKTPAGFKGTPAGAQQAQRSLEALSKTAKQTGKDMEGVGDDSSSALRHLGRVTADVTEETRGNWRRMARNADASLDDIRQTVRTNGKFIKQRLGEDSEEGRRALAKNFGRARDAIRGAMRDGRVSTRDGMREIRELLAKELRATYGITLKTARHQVAKQTVEDATGGDSPAGASTEFRRGGWVRRAMGGWIGARGMVSDDVVPIAPGAMAAYGEYDAHGPGGRRAILNRHQAPIVEAALAAGGYPGLDGLPSGSQLPILERALAPLGGLDRLFAAINRPHFLAGGGRVTGDTDVLPGLLAALRRMSAAAGQAISITSGRRTIGEQQALVQAKGLYGPSNRTGAAAPSPNAPHVRGIAADISPNSSVFGSMASRFGLAFNVPGEPWHIALVGGSGGAGGAAARPARMIRAPRARGGGQLGQVVQGALNMGARGANRTLRRAAARSATAAGAPGVGGGGGGGGGQGSVVAAFRRAAASAGATSIERLALFEAGIVESGLRNLPYGDRDSVGALQQRASQGWTGLTNPYRAALEFLSRARGLRPWRGSAGMLAQAIQRSAFPARYDAVRGQAMQYLAKGGRVGRAGSQTEGIPLKIRAKAHTGVNAYNGIMAGLDDLRRRYEQTERGYNQTDEQLLNEDGTVNQDAVKQRAGELSKLVELREQIRDRLKRAKEVADRVVRSLKALIRNYTRSLNHAKRKDRSGIRAKLDEAQTQLDEFRGIQNDLPFDIGDAEMDITDVVNERAEVLGTEAERATADVSGPADVSQDAQAQLDQAKAIAAVATERAEISERSLRVLGSAGGLNPGGIGAAPSIVQNNYMLHPADPSVLQTIARASNAGNSYGGNVRSPRDVLGA